MDAIDALALAIYAGAVLWIGLRVGGSRSDSADLQLAGRDLPAWAVLASLVATELSAATFIGVPAAAYAGDWSYLQFAIGALIGKLVVAALVIPLFYRLGIVTVYGLLAERFGPHTHRAAAACFIGGRILASGVRLFIAALAFAAVTGWSLEAAIIVCGLLAGAYTIRGGLRAVVWTDTLQAGVFLFAAAAILWILLGPDSLATGTGDARGISALTSWAETGQRMRIFHLDPLFSLASARPLGVGIAGGFFLTLATHSTDHDMVQRLLAARTGAAGSWALAASALLNFPLTLLFLMLGTAIAHAHSVAPPPYEVGDGSRILPLFALHQLPSGVRGLAFAGLFAAAMSSLDSAICAIATTWSVDLAAPARSDADAVRRMRRASAVVCGLLIVAALAMSAYHRALATATAAAPALSLVEFALSSMTVLYGGLLGVFAWAIVRRESSADTAGIAGLMAGSGVGLLLFLHPIALGHSYIAWPWWIPLGAACALATTALVQRSTRGGGRPLLSPSPSPSPSPDPSPSPSPSQESGDAAAPRA